MYSYEDRVRAVELYLKLGKRIKATIRQLGYGDVESGASRHACAQRPIEPSQARCRVVVRVEQCWWECLARAGCAGTCRDRSLDPHRRVWACSVADRERL